MISDIVAANFRITAFELFYLDRTHAEEFYEIYKGVVGEYSVSRLVSICNLYEYLHFQYILCTFKAMTSELSLGPCFAIEISGCGEETPKAFRDACGPADPVRIYVV